MMDFKLINGHFINEDHIIKAEEIAAINLNGNSGRGRAYTICLRNGEKFSVYGYELMTEYQKYLENKEYVAKG